MFLVKFWISIECINCTTAVLILLSLVCILLILGLKNTGWVSRVLPPNQIFPSLSPHLFPLFHTSLLWGLGATANKQMRALPYRSRAATERSGSGQIRCTPGLRVPLEMRILFFNTS